MLHGFALPQSNVAASNAKLALFYDWLFFSPEKDSIMNIGELWGGFLGVRGGGNGFQSCLVGKAQQITSKGICVLPRVCCPAAELL